MRQVLCSPLWQWSGCVCSGGHHMCLPPLASLRTGQVLPSLPTDGDEPGASASEKVQRGQSSPWCLWWSCFVYFLWFQQSHSEQVNHVHPEQYTG